MTSQILPLVAVTKQAKSLLQVCVRYVSTWRQTYHPNGNRTISPRQYPPGQYPPANIPPGHTPQGQYPQENIPMGNIPPSVSPLDNIPPGVTTSSFLQKDILSTFYLRICLLQNNISYITRQDIVTVYGTFFLYSKGSRDFQNYRKLSIF